MAEYYAVLSRAVAGIEFSSVEARRSVYDKARNALIGQLKAIDPPLAAAEISRQRLELEEAIRRVEREAAGRVAGEETGSEAAASAGADKPRRAEAARAGESPPAGGRTPADGRAGERGERHAPIERTPPPPASSASARAGGRPEPESGPQLAPDYGWEEEPAAATSRYQEPYVDRGERAPPSRRRRGDGDGAGADMMDRRARPSRLPVVILIVLIIVMGGGLAALGWSQRDVIVDLLAWFDSGADEVAPPPPAATAATAQDEPSTLPPKDPDRLSTGEAPQGAVRVVDPQSPGGAADSVAAAPTATETMQPTDEGALDPAAMGPQKAVLYEEPLDPAAAANGVVAIDGSVTWDFVAEGPNGPEIAATVDVPERNMTIRLAIRRNTDTSLPASHLVEVVIDTPADFPGQSIKSVPRMVLKESENGPRGRPLIGATATITEGFFWIALSGVDSDVTANLATLQSGKWIDLPLLYETDQRAILTIEKGPPGSQAFESALAAWTQ